eukprot:TRINITY_DN22953_c0_g1_i3.p1 TRINITY_DN22953_c0_g1~~TRINITY_DN22953_c0_g1_i3.p1  ORF type:complete len:121 (+),score=47.66 TRINITY_DN22953_c0_g1_i3:184-546(+)
MCIRDRDQASAEEAARNKAELEHLRQQVAGKDAELTDLRDSLQEARVRRHQMVNYSRAFLLLQHFAQGMIEEELQLAVWIWKDSQQQQQQDCDAKLFDPAGWGDDLTESDSETESDQLPF